MNNESKIEGNAKDGFVITNKNLAKTEVPVEKKLMKKWSFPLNLLRK